jgi:hypothetical protein
VDAETYSRYGLPWFEVYDSARGELPATSVLASIKSVDELAGKARPSNEPKAKKQVRPIPPRSRRKR